MKAEKLFVPVAAQREWCQINYGDGSKGDLEQWAPW
jgi:hypothetical protein